MYLDSLTPVQVHVGYGSLGTYGSLGYENKRVTVRRQTFEHALSTHPSARLVYSLGGRYTSFSCHVAINDDVPIGSSHADFRVLADGRQVAIASHVRAGEAPRALNVDVTGVETLELVVSTTRWEYCHAVWLNPSVDNSAPPPIATSLRDCLERVEISLPLPAPFTKRCVATVVSPGFEQLLDDMLGSLRTEGNCSDAQVVVFGVDTDTACERVVEKYGARLVRCSRLGPVNVTLKSLLYSVARVIDAEQFLCLDADMLVLGDLSPLFDALHTFPSRSILACREANCRGHGNLSNALQHTYRSNRSDLYRLLPQVNGEANYPLVVNDGLFAGSRSALLALDAVIRSMPQAVAWVDEGRTFCWWRNQFIFNLALAQLDCGIGLDDKWNVQLHTSDVKLIVEANRISADWQGSPVRVLHFCGQGRGKYPNCRGLYARGGMT